ncbi:MAG TPA: PEP/pyruvate-binding domain-containing protein, partial [Gemmataceae bacterium]|nr:PEP/pyruvate-binding domain-containing protein [Gemmataceae bacterium]
PVNPALGQILIESSYGLGEAIVLGKVTPDRFVLDRRSLKVIERNISVKDVVVATLARDGRGPAGARDAASLTDAQLEDLARLGLRVEAYFKVPCDIEWALSQGQFFLLQARPIKGLDRVPSVLSTPYPVPSTISPAERERVRQEEIAALRARAEPTGTVWSRFNLSEILPEPTPMSWAVVRRFMSGKGGYGLMYRDLGFDPDPALDEEGVFDLVCGRPYCNLSREARMHYRQLPFEHPFAVLKADPRKALYPQPVPNAARAGWRFWLFLPVLLPAVLLKMGRAVGIQRELNRTTAARLREELFPAFAAETAQAAAEDLTKLDDPALRQRLEHWVQRALRDFARDSLKPTALAGLALGRLERLLTPALGPERTQAALRELAMGVRPDPEADLPGAVQELAAGRLDRAAFLERFGHRGSQEMELSRPRWGEDPAAVDQLTKQAHGSHTLPAPAEVVERIAAEANLNAAQRAALEEEVRTLHTYLALRETAKHYLMRGYAQIRRILVELDRRHHLDGGIFFLTPEELPRLEKGEDLSGLIGERRRRREIALSLEVPQVLFSDDLEAIGRALDTAGADTLQGVPLSAGVAEGPALVLAAPGEQPADGEPYILVCPSTDPAWVPLFVRAKGLVMETGGVLSHGAIVAREFGLPAVAGLPDVHRRLRTGQRLRIDGATGTVTVLP